jgi:hypothetical protein
MGRRPTQRNEGQDVTPAKAGVHVREEVDSRFRGNDVTFDGEAGNQALHLCSATQRDAERDSSLGMTGMECA